MQLNHFAPLGVVTRKGNFKERIETPAVMIYFEIRAISRTPKVVGVLKLTTPECANLHLVL